MNSSNHRLTKRICLIGCGNVGSRHLQAIAKLPYDIQIDVVEPQSESKKIAMSRLDEIEFDKKNHHISWYSGINELEKPGDVTVVATTSFSRAELLKNLLEKGHSRFLIEKFVCQSNEEYEMLIKKFREFKAKGWVNTNPRCFEAYQKLKQFFEDSQVIHFSVTASNVSALATNSIHYLDLFSFFTNDYQIKLNGDFLLNELFPNKRGSNFVEFGGTIVGSINNGSTFSMTFLPSTNLPTVVNIIGNDKHIMIDETNEKLFDIISPENKKFSFNYEHASSLTTKIVKEILEKDECSLTTLEDSFLLHRELFRIFNAHIKKITNKEQSVCPIT